MANGNGTYPNLTIDVGQSAQRPTKRPVSTLEQTVEGALREVLAWRPRVTDPKGFQAALNQAFTAQEVNGRRQWAWTPRSYSVHADMGAITGAQASIYTRAKAALDQIVPLIEGLYALRSDPDAEDIEAIRALVKGHLSELTNELGVVGGPRLPRVAQLFTALLGGSAMSDPATVGGHLGTLRDRLGLESSRVNTIAEEQNLTNFRVVVDHVISLQQSWLSLARHFNPNGTDKFLGTQAILLSRAFNVVAESVQELEFKMDSVWLGAAERQTVTLNLGGTTLTIAELLSWVEQFASEEAPRLIRDAGKDGVIALQPTLEELHRLVHAARDDNATPNASFRQSRVQTGLAELEGHLAGALRLTGQIQRVQDFDFEITITQDPDTIGKPNVTFVIRSRGNHFWEESGTRVLLLHDTGARVLAKVELPAVSKKATTHPEWPIHEIRATFDLKRLRTVKGEWTIRVETEGRIIERPVYVS